MTANFKSKKHLYRAIFVFSYPFRTFVRISLRVSNIAEFYADFNPNKLYDHE